MGQLADYFMNSPNKPKPTQPIPGSNPAPGTESVKGGSNTQGYPSLQQMATMNPMPMPQSNTTVGINIPITDYPDPWYNKKINYGGMYSGINGRL